jgi:type I restriction enzyme S subunit
MKKYTSYKDSGVEWIGEIPDNWGVTKMKYVGDYLNGYPFKPTDWGDEGRLIIRIQNLTEGRGSENFYSGEIDPKYIVRTGDYLFSWSTTLGLYEWKRDEGLLNQHIFKVELNDILFKKYYFWVIQGVIKELSNESHGSTMTHLTKDVFGNIRLPLPPLSEQKQIVSYLDTKTTLIDSLIEKTKLKIQLLKENRTSLINEVVTKGLNPNVEMKDSGVEWIGEIPSGWVVSKLKYDSSTPVQYGINISGDKYVEEGIRFVRITDISESGDLNPDDGKYLVPEDVPNEFLLRKFDVLFCRSGHTVGKTYLHTSDGLFSSGGYLVRFNFRNYTESKFIFYLSKTHFYWDWIKLNTVVSTIENVNGDKYQNFIYPKPPLSEQQQIVSYLDEHTQLIDKTISVEQRRIDTLKEYRQSLISEVVTGKRKVTTDE